MDIHDASVNVLEIPKKLPDSIKVLRIYWYKPNYPLKNLPKNLIIFAIYGYMSHIPDLSYLKNLKKLSIGYKKVNPVKINKKTLEMGVDLDIIEK